MKELSKSLEDTERIAGNFISELSGGKTAVVVGLEGDLGSGKTTFTQAVARHLGVLETVTSPTFVIEKIYKLKDKPFNHLIHIDAYRLESGAELGRLGWREINVDPGNLILIEWPERVKDILPAGMKIISFKFIDEKTREITI